jgi:hypothetical protein
MSMISAQIDELRAMAQLEKNLERPAIARILGDAADTIWQLRDDLQQTNAENAKLREQIYWLKRGDILHVLTDQEYIDQCERERLMQVSIDALDKENAKLLELVRFIMHQCNEGNPRCDECIGWNDGECVALLRMRELGVEVDG